MSKPTFGDVVGLTCWQRRRGLSWVPTNEAPGGWIVADGPPRRALVHISRDEVLRVSGRKGALIDLIEAAIKKAEAIATLGAWEPTP
jgi:hypothetical protein